MQIAEKSEGVCEDDELSHDFNMCAVLNVDRLHNAALRHAERYCGVLRLRLSERRTAGVIRRGISTPIGVLSPLSIYSSRDRVSVLIHTGLLYESALARQRPSTHAHRLDLIFDWNRSRQGEVKCCAASRGPDGP